METEQFQTVKDIADMLTVGKATVRRWIKDGELRAIDIGRGWRIAPEDLDEFSSAAREPAARQREKGERGGRQRDARGGRVLSH